MSIDSSNNATPATVADRLRLGHGFSESERASIVDQLSSLDARLATYTADETELELSMKERDEPGQSVTLQCWIAGHPRLVATSSEPVLYNALADVRNDLKRQLNDAKTRSEPRNNRHLRTSAPSQADHPEE